MAGDAPTMTLWGGLASDRARALGALIARVAGSGIGADLPYLAPALLFSADAVQTRLAMPKAGDGAVLVHEHQRISYTGPVPLDRDLAAAATVSQNGALTEFRITLGAHGHAPVVVLDTGVRLFGMDQLSEAKPVHFHPERMGDTVFCHQIVVGQDAVDAYVALSGDRNPIHSDPDTAAALGLPGTIVPGLLLAALAQPFVAATLPGAALAQLRVRFMAPPVTGQTIRIGVQLRGADGSTGNRRVRTYFTGPENRALAVADLLFAG